MTGSTSRPRVKSVVVEGGNDTTSSSTDGPLAGRTANDDLVDKEADRVPAWVRDWSQQDSSSKAAASALLLAVLRLPAWDALASNDTSKPAEHYIETSLCCAHHGFMQSSSAPGRCSGQHTVLAGSCGATVAT
jgi:hypothetical protein